jgi:hypothetical protein
LTVCFVPGFGASSLVRRADCDMEVTLAERFMRS